MQKKILLLTLSIMLVLCFAIAGSCTQTFSVPALSQTTVTFGLLQGDQVTGNMNVTGGLTDDINFNITDPNGVVLQSYSHVTQTPISFSAETAGKYHFVFDNTFALLASKSVTLDYSIKGTSDGFSDLILPIIAAIVVVIVVVVVAVVLVSKRKAPKTA